MPRSVRRIGDATESNYVAEEPAMIGDRVAPVFK
jgi:hypothetical protein